MPKVTINGVELDVSVGTSVLKACEQIGIEIPRFCYHDRLSVAGCCRMCLVEIEKMPKPVASCAMPCADGMIIHTHSEAARMARADVMELLLLNHPLDCPVCDQAGQCDLQDQAYAFGRDRGCSREKRRLVSDKELGPLIKTCMTRCIHCMRCVRFLNEIAGTPELGGLFRGEHLEIDTGSINPLMSELSGNLIDLCPVGALTAKPYAHEYRPWELKRTPSIDVMDAVGSHIYVDSRGDDVMRIHPRENNAINGAWIHDKTRFSCDGLRYNRLDQPMIRDEGHLRMASWDEALDIIAIQLHKTAPEKMAALVGDLADCEGVFALKELMESFCVPHLDCRQDGAVYECGVRSGYLMNTPIADFDRADAILLIGTDLRTEAAMLNARILPRARRGEVSVGLIGQPVELNYPYRHIGVSPVALRDVLEDKSPFSRVLREAKNPAIILGAHVFVRQDGAVIHGIARELAENIGAVRDDWNGFNVLQLAASRVGGLDIGFLPHAHGLSTSAILQAASYDRIELIYLLGADAIDVERLGNSFVVYQGHHGDKGASRADVILPSTAYTEKSATYVNVEGRAQLTAQAVAPCGKAKDDWRIIRALSEATGHTLSYDTISQLHTKMAQKHSVFKNGGELQKNLWGMFGRDGSLTLRGFDLAVPDFYKTNIISCASPTMDMCSQTFHSLRISEPHHHTYEDM